MGNSAESARCRSVGLAALIALTLMSSHAAFASDKACPNTDAARAKVDALSALISSGTPRTTSQLDQLIVLDIKLSTAYLECASNWVGKNGDNVGYAEYDAAEWQYVAAQSENVLGERSDAINDIDSALSSIDSAINDLSNVKLIELAKKLKNDMTRAHGDW